MKKLFTQWLKDNLLYFESPVESVYIINSKSFLLIDHKEGKIIDRNFSLILSQEEKRVLEEVDFIVFLWGNKFYYTPSSKIKSPEFNILRYIGQQQEQSYPFLGIHGKYELLNGSKDYSEWCEKAKFLNINTLGICEKNTLAGTLAFQEECKKNNIKSILGETITIKSGSDLYLGKLFVANERGWKNLLLINTEINVNNPSKYITEERLFELTDGLVFVFHPAYSPFDLIRIKKYSSMFLECYFQLDSCQYDNIETDKQFILETNKYAKSFLEPILINDAYYLEKEDAEIKSTLNMIGGDRDLLSSNQWFKTNDESLVELRELFEKEVDFERVILDSVESLYELEDICNFKIETGKFKLPQYKMTKKESSLYKSNEDLFFDIIEKAFKSKVVNRDLNIELYTDRLEEEISVIQRGGFIDYFLILWDTVRFCKENDILTGIGRGSAGGSLIAFLMDITRVDPIPFKLLFSRFLNEGRLGKSLPDIDLDIEGIPRDKVKQYFEQKYGHDKFCSLGTYTSLMLKAAIKDISRTKGIDIPLVQKISNAISDPKAEWSEIFNLALSDPLLRKFIDEYPDIINLIQLCHTQPRSASVHACATVLVPEDESIFTSIPLRKVGEDLLVSEWEGEFIEKAGYLKEDLLGLLQLDKFRMIINLIKENYKQNIDIYSIPLDQLEVYEMFQKAQIGDIFQFGSKGLAPYLTQVSPENIEDLIAINALYRPGPIEGNAHNEFVLLRHGEREPIFYPGTEEITKDTYSLIIYQEQIMQICQKIGGFSLIEADDIRKAMGKKNQKDLDLYKERWFSGALENGYSEQVISELWDKMVAFGGYAFNRSHSAVYAITGYICQYLKWKYPLPYWITALEFANDDNVFRFLSEILKTGDIQIAPPDINKSDVKFKADFQTNKIIWSISKVKQVGPVAVQCIFEERVKNGQFFSLEEFLDRVDKSKVNKSAVENLIIAGAFDEIEGLKSISERGLLIKEYRTKMNTKVVKDKDWFSNENIYEDYFWGVKQKQVSGFAFIDYHSLIQNNLEFNIRRFMDHNYISTLKETGKIVVIAGSILEIEDKQSKKGNYMRVCIEQNYETLWVYIWSDIYNKFSSEIIGHEGDIVILSGRVTFDDYRKENVIQLESDSKIKIL